MCLEVGFDFGACGALKFCATGPVAQAVEYLDLLSQGLTGFEKILKLWGVGLLSPLPGAVEHLQANVVFRAL